MLDLFGADLEVKAYKQFCRQYPRMRTLASKVKTAVLTGEGNGGWTQAVKSVFGNIYEVEDFDSRRREVLDKIKDWLDRRTESLPGSSLTGAARMQLQAFCELAEMIFRAFPVMGEVFVDGSPSLCDALLAGELEEGRKDTLLYSWSHPLALMPLYGLLCDLKRASQAGGDEDGPERVLLFGAIYGRFVKQYSFFQPYRGRLYRFELDEDGQRIVGTPWERAYALHKVPLHRLTEKICYSVRELIELKAGQARLLKEEPVSLRFALVGQTAEKNLEALSELLLAELTVRRKPEYPDKLRLEITIFDPQSKDEPVSPSFKDGWSVEWVRGPGADITDSETLKQRIFEQYDAAFFIDLTALYRLKAREFKRPDRLPVFLGKAFSRGQGSMDGCCAAQRRVAYLTDFLREQSAAYTIRCSAQRLDLNEPLLKRMTALYKEKQDFDKPRVSYVYLAHGEVFSQSAAKYENISRIEDYDGAPLAIVRHINRREKRMDQDVPQKIFPITLWQIAKSVRSNIGGELTAYFRRRRTEYLSRLETEWQLVYALRRTYIVLMTGPDIARQDTLGFFCCVNERELGKQFGQVFPGEELHLFAEQLRELSKELLEALWKHVKAAEGSSTHYAAVFHSAFSKALYGRACSLEHVLIWHLYENKTLAKKACEVWTEEELARRRGVSLRELAEQVAVLSEKARTQPQDKHFYAHLVSNADAGLLGIMDMQQDVELHRYYYGPKDGIWNAEQALMWLRKSYGQIAKVCAELGYTDSALYTNAAAQSAR